MQRLIRIIDTIEHAVLVWTIVGLAVIGFIQVFGRYLFNYSFTWFEELGRYLGVFIAFLGAGIGAKKSVHFSMDLIVTTLDHPYGNYLRFSTSLLCAAFFFLITFYSGKLMVRVYGFQSTSPALGLPMYIAYMPIVFFSIVLGIRFSLNAVNEIKNRRIIKGSPDKGDVQ